MKWPVRTSSVIARAMSCVAVAAVGVLASCASLSGGARETFSKLATCPPERVTVVERPDYRRPVPPASPPPDVVADPERLALWHQQREKDRKEAGDNPCFGDTPFEATGCGRRIIMCCGHPEGSSPGTIDGSKVGCVPQPDDSPAPAGVSSTQGNVVVADATPEMLETLAAQMDASGQTAVAQRLRARAQHLRAAGTGPAMSPAPTAR
jgi:hypothetical protein